MIVGVLKGGLGNQLFQYAATRNLARMKKSDFSFDVSELAAEENRHLAIHNLLESPINFESTAPSFLRRMKSVFKPWYQKSYIKEKEGETLGVFPKFPDNCKIEGYWQNESFFKEIGSDLKEEIGIVPNVEVANCVAVHFRGGDYLAVDKKHFHGNPEENYYKEAFKFMSIKIPNVVFHLFSDTPEQFNLEFLKDYDTEWQQVQSDAEDLKKMATYQNFIIANSSYSWWAAWLGANKNSAVVCPSFWYKHKSFEKLSPALSEWKKIAPW
jgi:hypothetical protein